MESHSRDGGFNPMTDFDNKLGFFTAVFYSPLIDIAGAVAVKIDIFAGECFEIGFT